MKNKILFLFVISLSVVAIPQEKENNCENFNGTW